MPATLVTAAQRLGFARQRGDAVSLAALLVCEGDGDLDGSPACACVPAHSDHSHTELTTSSEARNALGRSASQGHQVCGPLTTSSGMICPSIFSRCVGMRLKGLVACCSCPYRRVWGDIAVRTLNSPSTLSSEYE
eukprot:scaffold2739_cov153-Isochrysis_galbana.AAC.2